MSGRALGRIGLRAFVHRHRPSCCLPVAHRITDCTTPPMSLLPGDRTSLTAGDEVRSTDTTHQTPVVPQAPALVQAPSTVGLATGASAPVHLRWLLLRPVRTVHRLSQRLLSCPALRASMRRLHSRATLLRHPRSNANHLGAHRRRVPTCRATSLLPANAGTMRLFGFVNKRLH